MLERLGKVKAMHSRCLCRKNIGWVDVILRKKERSPAEDERRSGLFFGGLDESENGRVCVKTLQRERVEEKYGKVKSRFIPRTW